MLHPYLVINVTGLVEPTEQVTDKIKDNESILDENVKNLDNNVRLGNDLEQSVHELWKILKQEENLQVATSSTNAILCNSFTTKEKQRRQKSATRKQKQQQQKSG